MYCKKNTTLHPIELAAEIPIKKMISSLCNNTFIWVSGGEGTYIWKHIRYSRLMNYSELHMCYII